MKRVITVALLLLSVNAMAARTTVTTLYRTSYWSELAPVKIAIFDTAEGKQFDRVNCNRARDLFQADVGSRLTFFCIEEKR